MRYTIVQLPKIDPRYIVVEGARGTETRLNPGEPVVRPQSCTACVYQDLSDIYGNDPTKRVQLWHDDYGVASDPQIFAACPNLRDYAASLIRSAGNRMLLDIAAPYQQSERETWAVQMTEAETWLQDNTRPTPMIDAICSGRNIDRPTLISYIMDNTNRFRQASGAILGMQQALLMQIYAATTVDEVFAVAWP